MDHFARSFVTSHLALAHDRQALSVVDVKNTGYVRAPEFYTVLRKLVGSLDFQSVC
jgi:hypothetical protein